MTQADLLSFLRSHHWAVQSSVSASGAPQSALVGFAVSDQLEIVFDTLDSTRKALHLRGNPRISFVIGGWIDGDERTVQYEGLADFPEGEELKRLKEIYFAAFPDGRDRQAWPGLVYVRAKPAWIRYSDFGRTPPEIQELTFG
ncbi:MAG TPA: pyridoxamine 5'-phosphate oxidase family protein [Thermoanaerobaculia bacterium]|nr:pyridoxamine 5'-phosphate oxidase family protein [Thermoanaerobaculia bacterium]